MTLGLQLAALLSEAKGSHLRESIQKTYTSQEIESESPLINRSLSYFLSLLYDLRYRFV